MPYKISTAKPPQTIIRLCVACYKKKEKHDFSKRQWSKGDARRCMSCLSNPQGKKRPAENLLPTVTPDAKRAKPDSNGQRVCPSCKETKPVHSFSGKDKLVCWTCLVTPDAKKAKPDSVNAMHLIPKAHLDCVQNVASPVTASVASTNTIPKAPETKMCSFCKEQKSSKEFTKAQFCRDNDSERVCVACFPKAPRQCPKCKEMKPGHSFSGKGKNICCECFNAQEVVCSRCKVMTARSRFSKKEFKKSDDTRVCTPCYKAEEAASSCSDEESEMSDDIRTGKSKFCDRTTHPEYFDMGGIAYENFVSYSHDDANSDDESPNNEDPPDTLKLTRKNLVGSYDMVHYHGYRECCDEEHQESISRSVPGHLEIRMVKWRGKIALCGHFSVARAGDGWCAGEASAEGSILELVHGSKSFSEPPMNGFDDLSDNGDDLDGELSDEEESEDEESEQDLLDKEKAPGIFAGQRYCTSSQWWDDYPLDSCDNEYFQASFNVMSRDVAYGLKSDEPNLEAVPSHPNTRGVVPKSLSHGKELLAKYEDGSNSWMLNHLPLKESNIALKIRKFVTPPPVLMLKKGDLVMHIEETFEPECSRCIVFRKKENREKEATTPEA